MTFERRDVCFGLLLGREQFPSGHSRIDLGVSRWACDINNDGAFDD